MANFLDRRKYFFIDSIIEYQMIWQRKSDETFETNLLNTKYLLLKIWCNFHLRRYLLLGRNQQFSWRSCHQPEHFVQQHLCEHTVENTEIRGKYLSLPDDTHFIVLIPLLKVELDFEIDDWHNYKTSMSINIYTRWRIFRVTLMRQGDTGFSRFSKLWTTMGR